MTQAKEPGIPFDLAAFMRSIDDWLSAGDFARVREYLEVAPAIRVEDRRLIATLTATFPGRDRYKGAYDAFYSRASIELAGRHGWEKTEQLLQGLK